MGTLMTDQFNFNRLSKAFYGHRSSSVFLTNILKYKLDRQLILKLNAEMVPV